MARPGRLELPTLCLEGRRSIQLSYGRLDCNQFSLMPLSQLSHWIAVRVQLQCARFCAHPHCEFLQGISYLRLLSSLPPISPPGFCGGEEPLESHDWPPMFSRGIQQGSKPTRMPCEVIPLKPKAFLGPRSGVRKDRSDRREWLRCNSEVASFLLVSNNSLATSFP